MPRRLPAPKKGFILTKERRAEFLANIADGKSTTYAAKLIGCTRREMIEYRNLNEEFANAWRDAYDQATDEIEDELMQLALGSKWGPAQIFLLKSRRPDVYATRLAPPQVLVKSENVTLSSIEKIESESAAQAKLPFEREIVIEANPDPIR